MNISARTVPIALVLGGVAVICAAISAYAYAAVNLYAYRDSFLTSIVTVAIIIGVVSILLGAGLFYWEREKYYQDRKEIHL
jgi:hypothetical protein